MHLQSGWISTDASIIKMKPLCNSKIGLPSGREAREEGDMYLSSYMQSTETAPNLQIRLILFNLKREREKKERAKLLPGISIHL